MRSLPFRAFFTLAAFCAFAACADDNEPDGPDGSPGFFPVGGDGGMDAGFFPFPRYDGGVPFDATVIGPRDGGAGDDGKPDAGDASTGDGGADAGAGDAGADAGANDGGADAGPLDGGADAGTSDGGACGSTTYDNFGKALMERYCLNCHNGQSGRPNFTTLAGIRANADKIKAQAVTGSAMPPFFTLNFPTSMERAQLGRWLDCGAP